MTFQWEIGFEDHAITQSWNQFFFYSNIKLSQSLIKCLHFDLNFYSETVESDILELSSI